MNIKQSIKSYDAKPNDVEYYEVKSDQIKYHHETDYLAIKNCEIKSHKIEYSNDYFIKNRFNNLIEVTVKDIRFIVNHINNGFNLKK